VVGPHGPVGPSELPTTTPVSNAPCIAGPPPSRALKRERGGRRGRGRKEATFPAAETHPYG